MSSFPRVERDAEGVASSATVRVFLRGARAMRKRDVREQPKRAMRARELQPPSYTPRARQYASSLISTSNEIAPGPRSTE